MDNNVRKEIIVLRNVKRATQKKCNDLNCDMSQLMANKMYELSNGQRNNNNVFKQMIDAFRQDIKQCEEAMAQIDYLCKKKSYEHCLFHPIVLFLSKSSVGHYDAHDWKCLCLECGEVIDLSIYEAYMGEQFGYRHIITDTQLDVDAIKEVYNELRPDIDNVNFKDLYEELRIKIPERQIDYNWGIVKTIPANHFSGMGEKQKVVNL